MAKNVINVALLDDHTLVRKAIKNLIVKNETINVTIDSENAEDLFDKLEGKAKVDVLLLDLMLSGITAREVLEVIQKKYPFIRVIVLSTATDLKIVADLLDMGILGYVFKGAEPAQLIDAVIAAYQNRIYQNKILTEALYWKSKTAIKKHYKNQVYLTETDKKILFLLWQEKSTREIATEIFLSTSTIEKIKQNLKEKVAAKTTVGLIKYAIENKIILVNQTAGL